MTQPSTDPFSFSVLPQENQAAFDALLAEMTAEHQPSTPTERFLVLEMARAQWKIARVAIFEGEMLHSDKPTWVGKLFTRFCNDYVSGNASHSIARYEASARRAFYLALRQLQTMRRLREPRPQASAGAKKPFCETKPIPAQLQRELDAHRRRDPLFDPHLDRSQLSKELQRYLDRSLAEPRV